MHEMFGPGKINYDINIRLLEERKKNIKDSMLNRGKPTDKITLTKEIFGEKKYFQQTDDTIKNKEMQKYVQETWES